MVSQDVTTVTGSRDEALRQAHAALVDAGYENVSTSAAAMEVTGSKKVYGKAAFAA